MRPFSKDGGKAAEQAAAKPLPDLIVSGSDSSTGECAIMSIVLSCVERPFF